METFSTQTDQSSGNNSFRSNISTSDSITPDYVRCMKRASDRMFCTLRDNIYIRFGQYEIKDYLSGVILMSINEEQQNYAHSIALQEEDRGEQSIETRTIKYQFGPHFLNLETLSLKLEFYNLTDEPIKDLLLIERFYFKDKLLSNFEFQFPFCIPGSKNECEFVYDLPILNDDEKQEMIDNPWEAQSDSFFFVNGQLIIHNKAAYNYSE